jgi:glycerol-3-phosphate cytidylyltransferase-like family protein
MKALVVGYAPVGKSASFAVDIGGEHKRGVPLKTKSKYQAELAGIKYVCQAIINADIDLDLKVTISHLPTIFAKDGDGCFKKRKKKNKLVDEVRELSTKFSSFVCETNKDAESINVLKMKAKSASI